MKAAALLLFCTTTLLPVAEEESAHIVCLTVEKVKLEGQEVKLEGQENNEGNGTHQPNSNCEPISFDVAGDYVFVAIAERGKVGEREISRGHINVYHNRTGAVVGYIKPPNDWGVGWMDMTEFLSVHRRENGEYLIQPPPSLDTRRPVQVKTIVHPPPLGPGGSGLGIIFH